MSIYFTHNEHFITLSGKTYVHRNEIKSLGGRFVGGAKIWQIPFSHPSLSAVEELCSGLGGGRLPGQPVSSDPPISTTSTIGLALSEEHPTDAPTNSVGTSVADGLTVVQLMSQAEGAITAAFAKPCWIIGEIQNISTRKMGYFFSLSEQGASSQQTVSVNAVCWRHQSEQLAKTHGKDILADIFQDGVKVRLLCQVQLYRGRGQISLMVMGIDPTFTKGQLALQREQLVKELRANGMYERNRSLSLPRLPFRVGLITADGSRAYGDFTHQLEDGGFSGQILYAAATMQGKETISGVCRALTDLEDAGADLIVLTRGGGSAADLRWFDDPQIAKKIANMSIPIIAAIGHHDDISVAEEIAYCRRKTPTAAADFILEIFAQIKIDLSTHAERLERSLVDALLTARQRLEVLSDYWQQVCTRLIDGCDAQLTRLWSRLDQLLSERILAERMLLEQLARKLSEQAWAETARIDSSIKELVFTLYQAGREAIQQHAEVLNLCERQLIANDPSNWLKRGWTQLWSDSGPVRSLTDATIGQSVRARLFDGEIELEITAQQSTNSNKTTHN